MRSREHRSRGSSACLHGRVKQWFYAETVVYCPAALLTKASLLLLIARVFSVRVAVRRAIHLYLVVLFVAYLIVQIFKMLVCLPIAAYWDPNIKGECLHLSRLYLTDSGLALVTDAVVLVLPVLLIWPLQMSTAQKLRIISLLGLGVIAVGVVGYRVSRVATFRQRHDWVYDMTELDFGV